MMGRAVRWRELWVELGRAVRWRELWVELGKKNYPERSGTTQSEAELPRAQRNYPEPPLLLRSKNHY